MNCVKGVHCFQFLFLFFSAAGNLMYMNGGDVGCKRKHREESMCHGVRKYEKAKVSNLYNHIMSMTRKRTIAKQEARYTPRATRLHARTSIH